nr:class I SAM-dependent methyltransferase [Haliscomenobacter hydrossis]
MNPHNIKPPSSSRSCCRFCASELKHNVLDLGMSPLCQKHITPQQTNEAEKFYPLHVYVCEQCWLVQLEEFATPEEIFAEDYAYFSSYSDTWLEHCRQYAELMIDRFGFDAKQRVVEIASNDGYLLQWFVQKGIPVLGIEPAENVAAVAIEKGIPTEVLFFGTDTAQHLVAKYGQADLLLGNNVLAHVPDINDFVKGMKNMLAPGGLITMEFPHLKNLIEGNQFDTIYHEHFSYLSFVAVNRIFAQHGITLFDVQELPTHGGSLRIFGRHSEDQSKPITAAVQELLHHERQLGMETLAYYAAFEEKVKETKRNLLSFLIEAKRAGKTIVGYGAPGKGNTLLNYCGIRSDLLDYTVDRSPHKQGNFLPGTRIPIYHPDKIKETRPDYVMILPWNLKTEISQQMAYIQEWGGKFVIPIPAAQVFDPVVFELVA